MGILNTISPSWDCKTLASFDVYYNDDSYLPWARCWTPEHGGWLWFEACGIPQSPSAALLPSHTHVPLSQGETNTTHLSFLMISAKGMLSAYVSGRSLSPHHFRFSRPLLSPSIIVIPLSSVEMVESVRALPSGCFVRETSNRGKYDKGGPLFLWWCWGTSGLYRLESWLAPWVLIKSFPICQPVLWWQKNVSILFFFFLNWEQANRFHWLLGIYCHNCI